MLNRTKHLLIALLCLNAHCLYAVIPFGDFTSWTTNSLGFPDPDGWQSTNLSEGIQVIFNDTDRTGGPGYSAKFITKPDSISVYYHGRLQLANQPFNGPSRPMQLEGYWKANFTSFNSYFIVEAHMYNAASVEIGSGEAYLPSVGNFINWTSFNFPINYSSSDPVASYQIDILLNTLSSLPTLVTHIDDLSFDVSTTGIGSADKYVLNYSLKYLQTGYLLELEKNRSGSLKIDIIDQYGRIISDLTHSHFVAGLHRFEFDLVPHAKGIYFCRIDDGDRPRIVKLIN